MVLLVSEQERTHTHQNSDRERESESDRQMGHKDNSDIQGWMNVRSQNWLHPSLCLGLSGSESVAKWCIIHVMVSFCQLSFRDS